MDKKIKVIIDADNEGGRRFLLFWVSDDLTNDEIKERVTTAMKLAFKQQ